MTILQSIFLGLLQGWTEFLPISSSGHLNLAQRLFGVQASLFFDVALHLGTFVAVVLVYKKSLHEYIKKPLQNKKLRLVAIASMPTFVLAFVIKTFVGEDLFANLLPIGFALTIVLLVVSHCFYKPRFALDNCPVWTAIVCGIVQGVAVFPGLSRSGSTVSTLKLCGWEQKDATQFSFILSLPVIAGSALVEGLELINTPISTPWYCVAIGVFFSFLSGYSALWLLKKLSSNRWVWFAFYLPIPLLLSIITL